MKTIHILNGDSTLAIFNKSGLEGETLVWRDVLSQGPVNASFGSDQFWADRETYMTSSFEIEPGKFQTDVIDPFKAFVSKIGTYKQVVLWFEYDLFCQINMLGLMSYLGEKVEPGTELSLVCTGHIEGYDKLMGLGELPADIYTQLYNTRLKLGTREFEYAQGAYDTYSSADVDDLYTYMIMPFHELPYLAAAFEAHWKRFPSSETGLSEIEEKMLEFIKEGVKTDRELVGKMLRWQTTHGFGDLQYFGILERIKPLFTNFEKLELKPNLDKATIESLIDRNYWLGGAKASEWQYNPNTQEIERK
ncbi:hypothetical protein [Roseivirga pacifica]|uniref:hypothetical protein n=1 Tax=Roseivirga pacifica TaxID=1267423 RepID=UPI003BA91678